MKTVENFLANRGENSRLARIAIHLLAFSQHVENWSRAKAGIGRELQKFPVLKVMFF